jgi:hypothetical protein
VEYDFEVRPESGQAGLWTESRPNVQEEAKYFADRLEHVAADRDEPGTYFEDPMMVLPTESNWMPRVEPSPREDGDEYPEEDFEDEMKNISRIITVRKPEGNLQARLGFMYQINEGELGVDESKTSEPESSTDAGNGPPVGTSGASTSGVPGAGGKGDGKKKVESVTYSLTEEDRRRLRDSVPQDRDRMLERLWEQIKAPKKAVKGAYSELDLKRLGIKPGVDFKKCTYGLLVRMPSVLKMILKLITEVQALLASAPEVLALGYTFEICLLVDNSG